MKNDAVAARDLFVISASPRGRIGGGKKSLIAPIVDANASARVKKKPLSFMTVGLAWLCGSV